jgi:hypothetical protein
MRGILSAFLLTPTGSLSAAEKPNILFIAINNPIPEHDD